MRLLIDCIKMYDDASTDKEAKLIHQQITHKTFSIA